MGSALECRLLYNQQGFAPSTFYCFIRTGFDQNTDSISKRSDTVRNERNSLCDLFLSYAYQSGSSPVR